jgi:hypothetical protein
MKPPHHPGGRGPYQRLSVIKSPDSARLALGQSEPATDDRRARAAAQWGSGNATPRHSAPATIDIPLPPRVQTLLSYRLDPALSRQLAGGPGPLPASRREAQQPVKATLVMGVGRADREDPATGYASGHVGNAHDE